MRGWLGELVLILCLLGVCAAVTTFGAQPLDRPAAGGASLWLPAAPQAGCLAAMLASTRHGMPGGASARPRGPAMPNWQESAAAYGLLHIPRRPSCVP